MVTENWSLIRTSFSASGMASSRSHFTDRLSAHIQQLRQGILAETLPGPELLQLLTEGHGLFLLSPFLRSGYQTGSSPASDKSWNFRNQRLQKGIIGIYVYFFSRISTTSARAPSRASQTTVAPHRRTASTQLAGAKPWAAAVSMGMSLASSPTQ